MKPEAHPVDELSALLDGELAPDEDTDVRSHLARCPACRSELTRVADARAALRSLGRLDPPPGWSDRLRARLHRLLLLSAGAAAAVAAAAAATIWAASPPPSVVAPVRPDAAPTPAATGGGAVSMAAVPDGYVAPRWLAGLRRTAMYRVHDAIRVVYSDGVHVVAVLEQEGRLDRAAAGAGHAAMVGGAPAVDYRSGSTEALSWQQGPSVVTVTGAPEAVLTAARRIPAAAPRSTLLDRLRGLCREVVEDITGSR